MSKFKDLFNMVAFNNIDGDEFEKELAEAIMERYPRITKERAELIVSYAMEDVGINDAMYVADKYAQRFCELLDTPV